MRASAIIGAVSVLGLLVLAAPWEGRGARGTGGVQVFVNNNAFCAAAGASCSQPLTTQIDPGQTVTWVDGQAGTTHSVTNCLNSDWTGCRGSPGILFDSANLLDPPSQYTSFTFETAGAYFYRCEIHTGVMRAIVQVGPASLTPTPSPTPSPSPVVSPSQTASPTPTATPMPTATPTVSPAPTATHGERAGDVNCDGLVDESDAFEILEFLATGDAGTGGGCDDIGNDVGGGIKGDVDCDGQVTPADALLILISRSGATLPPLPSGCPGP